MIQIRKNVFETNSSSTHSLVISNKERTYNYSLPVEAGVLTIPFGEFGWGPELLVEPIEKLSYLVTDRIDLYDIPEEIKDDEDAIQSLIRDSEPINEIIDAIKYCCPEIEEVRFEIGDSWNPFGYVDHQSCGTSRSEGLSIEEIVFSNKVIIMISNDNGYYYEDYFTSWDGRPATKDIETLFNA
jgi:hypothetical protein